MKKFLFAVLFALICLTTAFAAGKELQFTSTVTGITFRVPANVKVIQDDIEAIILQTPDQMYTFTAEAFNVAEASQDEITAHMVELATSAKMDLENLDDVNNTTEYMTLIGMAYDYENGGAAVVGAAVVNDTELGFYITVVAGPDYVDYAVNSLVTIDFDPDAVED